MTHYVWKANSLYLNKIYIGKIVPLYPFVVQGQDGPPTTCAAFIQTIPTGEMVGLFPSQELARTALLKAAGVALEDFIA